MPTPGSVHAPIPGRVHAPVRQTGPPVVTLATVSEHDRAVIFCDLSHTEPAVNEPATPQHNPWLSVAIVCLAQLMVVLDATIVNVALPSIQHGLELSPATCSGWSTRTR